MPRGISEGHSVRIFVRMTPELRDEAREAARLTGVEMSEWIRGVVERAATRVKSTKKRRKLARR